MDNGRCCNGCPRSEKFRQRITRTTLLSFRFSSSACREEISAGIVLMELLERSNRSNWVRPQNARGKLDSWFDARCTSLKCFSNIFFVQRTALRLPQSCHPLEGCRNGGYPIEVQFEVGQLCQLAPRLIDPADLVFFQIQDPQLLEICPNFWQLFDPVLRKVYAAQS